MSPQTQKRPHGQLRQSQLLTSFGPGAMVDLPDHSILIGGLDTWSPGGDEISEPRLVEKLKKLFNPPLQALTLKAPPPDLDDPTANQTGIAGWQFPEWFVTQDVDNTGSTRARMLVHRKMLTRGKFIDDDRRKRSVVPVRFVRACRAGHIGDIDWRDFVHGGKGDCHRQLWLEQRGTTGDLSEMYVRCECGAEQSLLLASDISTGMLGRCDGSRPWLGAYARERCGEPNRLLIRSASNAYFAQLMSVISLPPRSQDLSEAVQNVWDFLEIAENADDVSRERRRARVNAALEGFTDEEVFAEINVQKGASAVETKSVKQAELETLCAQKDEIGEDRPNSDFLARSLPNTSWDKPWMDHIERVVLVHRLREVIAQVGFTRFEAVSADVDGELEMGVKRASLTRDNPTWLPAIENRGEGIFLQFKKSAVDEWLQRAAVKKRGAALEDGFKLWAEEHSNDRREFLGLPYILMHSFSHLLVTAVSLGCGYPSSSIRERVFALPDSGYGVLLFTASSDAEGTLGGLVEVGRDIAQHVRRALELGRLCSNDPVCAQHDPASKYENRYLHGAACHGCLLISETSCEQHNDFLDRSLVVPTVDNLGAEFFQGDF